MGAAAELRWALVCHPAEQAGSPLGTQGLHVILPPSLPPTVHYPTYPAHPHTLRLKRRCLKPLPPPSLLPLCFGRFLCSALQLRPRSSSAALLSGGVSHDRPHCHVCFPCCFFWSSTPPPFARVAAVSPSPGAALCWRLFCKTKLAYGMSMYLLTALWRCHEQLFTNARSRTPRRMRRSRETEG